MLGKVLSLATATVILITAAAPDAAHAKRGRGTHVIEKHFETRGPVKGYSGFAGRYYCDYQRVPTRKCIITASGHESCKIVSWTLKQACY